MYLINLLMLYRGVVEASKNNPYLSRLDRLELEVRGIESLLFQVQDHAGEIRTIATVSDSNMKHLLKTRDVITFCWVSSSDHIQRIDDSLEWSECGRCSTII